MAVHEQPQQPRSAFPTLANILHPEAHAAAAPAPATFGLGGVQAPQAAPRIAYDPSIFSHLMDDVLTVGGKPVASTSGPAAGQVQAGPTVAAAAAANAQAGAVAAKPTVAAYSSTIDKQLDAEITGNRTTRTTLDAEKKSGAATAGATEHTLNDNRQHLLDQLNERSGVYDHDIAAINAQLGGTTPKHPTAAQQDLINQRGQLTAQKSKYGDQQTSLQRWHDRNQINDINTQLANPALTPAQRTALTTQKRTLATGLLSTVKHYEQFDARWGDTTYGKDKSYTSMTDAGCGPTALADLMDFKDQEDPEGQHSRGVKDPYTPRAMANYATNHGRVKGSGTSGDQMFGDLSGSFAGVQGNTIANRASATEQLNNGIPVAMIGHDIHGSKADGTAVKPYGGHFMVLSGVSEDGNNFSVTDGGRNNTRNIHSMTKAQVGDATQGYWTVGDNKHPAARPNS